MVGGKRVRGAERDRNFRIDETVGRAVDAADRLVRNFRPEPEILPDPRAPVLHAARPEALPVVDEQRPLAFRLGQEIEHHIDVLPRAVHHRHEDGRSRRIGELLVPADVIGKRAGKFDAAVLHLELHGFGDAQPILLAPVAPGTRQLVEQGGGLPPARTADEENAVIVDHKQRRGLAIVRTCGGARRRIDEHRPEVFRRARWFLQRAVMHDDPGQSRGGDQDRLFQRLQPSRRVGAAMAELIGQHRHAARDASRAALVDGLQQRVMQQCIQSARSRLPRHVVSSALSV